MVFVGTSRGSRKTTFHIVEYTSLGTYVFVVPKGVDSLTATIIGGGGGGGSEDNANYWGSPGGPGLVRSDVLIDNLIEDQEISIIVGDGGLGSQSVDSNGYAGETSSVEDEVSTGGIGGIYGGCGYTGGPKPACAYAAVQTCGKGGDGLNGNGAAFQSGIKGNVGYVKIEYYACE